MDPQQFFEWSADVRLVPFLQEADAGLVLVCDAAYRAHLAGGPLADRCAAIDDPALPERLAHATLIGVCTTADEPAARARVEPAAPSGTPVLGLYADLHALATARLPDRLTPTLAARLEEPLDLRRVVVIVNLPRSGSYFLAECLEQVGIGHPTEHLRPAVVAMLEARERIGFEPLRWLRNVARLTSRDGIFATKTIFGFLRAALSHLTDEEWAELRAFAGRTRLIYLWRRNKLLQAISAYRAQRTRVFQVLAGTSATPQAEVGYDFDGLTHALRSSLVGEAQLEAFLAKLDLPILAVEYEALAESTAHYLEGVLSFLGCADREVGTLPPSRNQIMRDATTAAIADRFLADHRERHGQTPVIEREPDPAVPGARSRWFVYPPPEGMGLYQRRDWHVVDYQQVRLPGQPELFRGPSGAPYPAGGYVACLGAAQTFGAFVAAPFPALLERELGRPALNLGYGGAGPRFFLDRPALLSLAGDAAVAVVQVMSGRSVANSLFDNPSGRNVLVNRLTGKSGDDMATYREVERRCGRALVEFLLEECRRTWVAQMRDLLGRLRCPTILLWFSERAPELDRDRGRDLGDLYGKFPQLVDRGMIEALVPYCTRIVEVVSRRGFPQALVSRIDGEPTVVRYSSGHVKPVNDYYPSPEMHEDAAAKLVPVVRDLWPETTRGERRAASAVGSA